MKKKFQCVFEGIAKAGNPTLLNQIYTELYITEGGTAEVNDEHEIRQIETVSRKSKGPETTIRQEDIFKSSLGRDEPIRTVLTKGVAGIGKTVLTQKFTLDWAEDKANQEIQFIFPFTFRELNVLKEEKFSLVELVHHFFTKTKESGICRLEDFQVVFILDGLDECRLSLDFNKTKILTETRKSTSLDVLLTNLIKGNLLPSARLWITTRPASASQIPPECVDLVTEVRGFTDPQKEEYFRKRFRDEEQTSRIISHIKTSRSLHIMCHIPVFCWITATVLEDVLKTTEGGELPKNLTEMYIHFLVVQAKVKRIKYDGGTETDPHWSPESRKMIESLGKLAFDQLQKGNLIFYESDLTECGIDIRTASVYSGVFTQIFKEERGLYQDKVFCFVHLSVQEFLAALHVHLTFINSGVNQLEEQQTSSQTENDFYQSSVDKALQSPNGHLDLFLRFLLGLKTNKICLQGLVTQTGSSLQTNRETVQYIKNKLSENLSVEKNINLFQCLNELNDRSLVEEIQQSLSSGSLSTDKLSPAQWSALVFILLSSEKDLDVFDLKKYSASEEALLRLLPVVKASKKALLNSCNLSERACEALSSSLQLEDCELRALDLSNNNVQDSGLTILFSGLKTTNWKLETLRSDIVDLGVSATLKGLKDSKAISWEGVSNSFFISCQTLSSLLSSQPSSLRELDLSNNDLKDSGVKVLSSGLESLCCKLETLRLSGCLITEEGCKSLVSAFSLNSSHLKELDLSYNNPGEAVVKMLEQLRLDTLRYVDGRYNHKHCLIDEETDPV
uniref:NACHT domain-containing protein n=1 Tax=Maylandia zebra TaxID=106582 RepID=A0A3P9C4Z3_9CICH